jgi:hypothetical protein
MIEVKPTMISTAPTTSPMGKLSLDRLVKGLLTVEGATFGEAVGCGRVCAGAARDTSAFGVGSLSDDPPTTSVGLAIS